MEINKEHIKLMKQCIGFKHKGIFSNKFKAKQNYFFYYRCSLEQLKLWNELCKMKLACSVYPFKAQPYYTLTEKGIRYLELKYLVQISV